MYPELSEKTIMISGAAGFLGQATARYFGGLGANLALVDLQPDKVQERLGTDFKTAWQVYDTDITDSNAVGDLMKNAQEQFGRLDVLINIAGGYAGGPPTTETAEATWDKMMALNAKSAFLMSSAFASILLEQNNGGRIINIGAKPGLQGTKNHSAYAASKSAVLRLTETMSAELRPHHITVNAVIPSMLDTAANRQAMPDADFDKWVTPASLAGVLGFLASDAARDISGALIPVYGGLG